MTIKEFQKTKQIQKMYLSKKELPYGVSFAVNSVIVKFMGNLRYIDQLGKALPMVYQEAIKNGKGIQSI